MTLLLILSTLSDAAKCGLLYQRVSCSIHLKHFLQYDIVFLLALLFSSVTAGDVTSPLSQCQRPKLCIVHDLHYLLPEHAGRPRSH